MYRSLLPTSFEVDDWRTKQTWALGLLQTRENYYLGHPETRCSESSGVLEEGVNLRRQSGKGWTVAVDAASSVSDAVCIDIDVHRRPVLSYKGAILTYLEG